VQPEPPFDERRLNRTILRLALPAMGENLLITFVLMVDTVLIGWLEDPNALAGMSLAGTLWFVIQGLFIAIGVGATALVARAWGAGDRPAAARAGEQAIGVAFVSALALGMAGFALAPSFFEWMGAEPEVREAGSTYVRIIVLAAPASLTMMVANAVLRGSGDTMTPLLISGIYNVVNLVGDLVLIFGAGPVPAFGMPGAAMATAFAGYAAAGAAILAIRRKRTPIDIRFGRAARWDAALVRRLFRIAAPSLLEVGLHRGSHLVFIGIVASLGTTALAAHAVGVRIEALSFMPGFALSVAAATLVGQSLGAGNPALAERTARRIVWMGAGLMGALATSFLLFGPQIAAAFRATPEIVRLTGVVVRIGAVAHPFMAWYFVLAGAHRGAGDTRTPLIITALGAVVLRLALVYLFGLRFGWGLPGVWIACNVDWIARAVGMEFFFRRGRWKTVRV
jgi:putative MATE family efflux protein